ncbi:4Fe-4S binding protein [Oscillospiraceae bacterium MB08-C2-2]|nr:4Fe-4S binding protein [Oscillospiraceae bacterium MB08-C2-2]
MSRAKKIAAVSSQCVACGCCVKACPLGAILVPNGIRAEVSADRCVGAENVCWPVRHK